MIAQSIVLSDSKPTLMLYRTVAHDTQPLESHTGYMCRSLPTLAVFSITRMQYKLENKKQRKNSGK